MKIYVCYGTWLNTPPITQITGHKHVCGEAYHSLVDAGHQPEVVKAYGLGPLPAWMNRSKGRREVRKLTGQQWVPVLVTDDGTVISGSRKIIDWAAVNPVTGTP